MSRAPLLLTAVALATLLSAFAPERRGWAADESETPGIVRVILPPERIAAELERAHRGGLHLMPRTAFEDLVRGATRPPRAAIVLIGAAYRAKLAGTDLVGTGEWTIRNPNRSPGLMSVEPFQVALRKARWSDGQSALLGPLSARAGVTGNEVLVERSGDSNLVFEWSARGVAEPSGTRFDVRVPACSVASVELDLPADRMLNWPNDSCVGSGPLPGPSPDRRSWRLNVGRSTDLDLTVLPVTRDSSGPSSVLARQRSRIEPAASQISCEFAFDLEVLRGLANEFVVDCELGFQPLEVNARSLDRWTVQSDAIGRRTQITVRMHDAIAAGTLTIRGFMPPADAGRWVVPRATLRGAIRRGETITVRIGQDIAVDDWRSGSFSIIESSGVPDQFQTIVLQTSPLGGFDERPSARLRVRGERTRVGEKLWWSVEAEQSSLLAQLSIEPIQGVVASIPLQVPKGWAIDRVETAPADSLESWRTEPAEHSMLVRVELARPIAAGQRIELRLAMTQRSEHFKAQGGSLRWPDVVPLGAAERSGFIAMRLASNWRVRSQPEGAPPALNSEERSASPWGAVEPNAVVTLRRVPLDRPVGIEPRTERVSVTGQCDIEIWPERMSVRRRLGFTTTTSLDRVALMESNRGFHGGEWRVSRGPTRVKSSDRITMGDVFSIVASGNIWSALPAVAPWGELRRIVLTESTTGSFELESLQVEPTEELSRAWPSISLPRVMGADPVEWRIEIVQHPGVALECRTDGIFITDERWDGLGRRMRSATGRINEVQLSPANSASSKPSVSLAQAQLIVDATDPGQLKHSLTIDAWSNREPIQVVELPAAAQRVRARINNKDAIIAKSSDLAGGGTRIELPLPSTDVRLRILVEYEVAQSRQVFGGFLSAAMPILPKAQDAIRTIWRLPADVEPVHRENWISVADPDSERNRARIWVGEGSPGDCFVAVLNTSICRKLSVAISLALFLIGALFAPSMAARWAFVAGLGLALTALALPSPLDGLARWPLMAFGLLVIRPWIPRGIGSISNGPSRRPQVAVMAFAVAITWVVGSRAGPPSPAIVYIVPSGQDATKQELVLAPLGLADRLREAAGNAPARDGVAAVGAVYRGEIQGEVAKIHAILEIHAFGDEPAAYLLPFGIANLREVRLDGQPVFPTPKGDRLAIVVAGKGGHVLNVEFSVPCPLAAEREVRFSIPELPQCQLTFAAPRGVEHLRALAWRGAQEVVVSDSESRLNVDLGRVGAVHVRWTHGAPSGPATIRTHEASLWDFRDSSSRLYSSIRWTIENGRATSLETDVPDELEIVTVVARPIDLPAGQTPSAWLQSWELFGAQRARRLRMTFSAPISGTWQSVCEYVSREPTAAELPLRLPAPHGISARETAFAWRSGKGHFTPTRLQNVAEISAEVFQRDFWLPAKAEPDPRPVDRAFVATRTDGAPIVRLAAGFSKPTATGAIEWTISPAGADIVCHCHYSSPDDKVSLCEWEIAPSITINNVASPDLLTWSRSSNRLQIWLQKATGETDVQWTGSFVANSTPFERFELPAVRALNSNFEGTLRVVSPPGWQIAATGLQQLESRPGHVSNERKLDYRVLGTDTRGTFLLKPVDPPQEVRPTQAPPKLDRTGHLSVTHPVCLLADMFSTPTRDRGWVHSVHFAVRGPGNREWRLNWPEPVRVCEIRVDQVQHQTPDGPVNIVKLPGNPRAETQWIRVTWMQRNVSDSLVRPPSLQLTAGDQTIEPNSLLWTVAVPPNLRTVESPPPLPREELARLRSAARMPVHSPTSTFAFCTPLTWDLKAGSEPVLRWLSQTSFVGPRVLRVIAIVLLATAGLWAARQWGRAIRPELLAALAFGGWLASGGFVWLIPLALAGIARIGSMRRLTDATRSARLVAH